MSLFKIVILRLKIRYLRHEVWVLRTSIRFPIMSIYLHATLWIWIFVAVLPFSLLALVLMETGGRLGAAISLFPATAGLILMLSWTAGWYGICSGLMFGHGKSARRKYDELTVQLERLKQCLRRSREKEAA